MFGLGFGFGRFSALRLVRWVSQLTIRLTPKEDPPDSPAVAPPATVAEPPQRERRNRTDKAGVWCMLFA